MLYRGVYVGFTIINIYRLPKYILILYSVGDRDSDMLVNFRKMIYIILQSYLLYFIIISTLPCSLLHLQYDMQ